MNYNSLKQALSDLNIDLKGLRRQYLIKIDRNYFNIENSTPIYFELDLNTTFYVNSWAELVGTLVEFIYKNYVDDITVLKRFKCSWNNKYPFSKIKQFDTSIKVCDDLYLNFNFSALHSYWFIHDILDYFNIDFSNSKISVSRTQKAEDKNVTKLVHEAVRDEFDYYMYSKGFDENKRKVILNNMNFINKMLSYISKDYFDFYLFDSVFYVNFYRTKVIRNTFQFKQLGPNGVETVKKCLGYYQEFYKNLLKIVK